MATLSDVQCRACSQHDVAERSASSCKSLFCLNTVTANATLFGEKHDMDGKPRLLNQFGSRASIAWLLLNSAVLLKSTPSCSNVLTQSSSVSLTVKVRFTLAASLCWTPFELIPSTTKSSTFSTNALCLEVDAYRGRARMGWEEGFGQQQRQEAAPTCCSNTTPLPPPVE